MRHLTKAHVRWDDLDGFGHVNNASYLTYIQEARANFTWYSRKEQGLEPIFSDMVVGRAEVVAYKEMLAQVYSNIEQLVKEGKTLEEVVAAKPTAEFDAVWGSPERLLPAVYAQLKGE